MTAFDGLDSFGFHPNSDLYIQIQLIQTIKSSDKKTVLKITLQNILPNDLRTDPCVDIITKIFRCVMRC